MNLQNKIWIMLFALGIIMWGCDSLIYEDMADCPQGVYVGFYSMTPCAVDSTFIGDVSDLHLFAFDDKDRLVSVTHREKVLLDKNFSLLVPVSNGYFSFIGWAGVNDNFSTGEFKTGTTSKKDVMLALKSKNNQAFPLSDHKVWQGESPSIFLQDPVKVGSEYKHTSVNLRQVTNRINVIVELHESVTDKSKPEDYTVEIASGNGNINIDGSMPLNQQVLSYPSVVSYSASSLKAQFSLMDLKTGYNNLITVKNKESKTMVWQGDLLGSILLKNNNVNLECQNDFDVKFIIKDKCLNCGTYICWAIYVNDWLIHSYETELDGNSY